MLKILIIAGARPNFMKVAPLIRAAEAWNKEARNGQAPLEWRLVHTGQHYDATMSDIFFRELRIPPPHASLGVGSGSHASQTAKTMLAFEPICIAERPDWVVVVGDVNSTLACALVAAKLGIRCAHVEAGLRSFDRTMPEEINRIVTDAIADLLFTPSEDASENLRAEGVAQKKIRMVGNVMIDSLVENAARAEQSDVLGRLGLEAGKFVYVTLHRPANVDERESLSGITRALKEVARRLPVIFPVHPRTRKMFSDFGLSWNGSSQVKALEPLGYHDSLCLTRHARLVLTDSGGLQEESTFFGTPCLTLRPNTERPVTITMGSNRLTQLPALAGDIETALNGAARPAVIPPLWDGRTAQRIVRELAGA